MSISVPEDDAQDQVIEPGEGEVEITTHLISLTYEGKLHPHNARYAQGLLDGKFIGQRSPVSGKVGIPSRGYDPIARVMLTPADDVEISPTGNSRVLYRDRADQVPRPDGDGALPQRDDFPRRLGPGAPPCRTFGASPSMSSASACACVRSSSLLPSARSTPSTTIGMYPTVGDVIERWEPTGEPDVPIDQLPETM